MATVRKSQNGWPVHPTSAGCVPLSWITGRVDPKVHDLFDRFCQRFNAEVEPITRAHSWGYANRPIRGSSQISNHASGTAIDLNAPAHPLGKSGTFTSAQVRAIKRILADFPQLRWGGTYSGRKDEMHFELNVKPEALNVTARMVSPAEGRFTSGYGKRNLAIAPWHAGVDIANAVGTPVYAPFDGTVRKVGSNIAPARSGDRNILISNPDGEGNYFGHLERARVKVGQKVKAGDRIGDMGARGNVTGPHLHLELWSDWRNPNSHYNPKLAFDKHGVTIGSKPKTTTGGGGSPAAASTKKENDVSARDMWKFRGFDYANPKAKQASTKDHQVSRSHQYILAMWKHVRTTKWRTWLRNGIWAFRGLDYVNSKDPATKNHQLARAHEYSFKQPSRVWSRRYAPFSPVSNSYPSIRKDGFTMRAWLQYAYLWARRAYDQGKKNEELLVALAKAEGDHIYGAVTQALADYDKRHVQVDIAVLDAAADDTDDPDAALAADAEDPTTDDGDDLTDADDIDTDDPEED